MILGIAKALDKQRKERLDNANHIPTRYELATTKKFGVDRGHGIIDDIRAGLRDIDKIRPRTYRQKQCHEDILSSLARFIYGPDFAANELAIKKRNRWESFNPTLILSAPRRLGKTEIIAMMIATLIAKCPKCEICCVSNSATAADGNIGMISKVRYYLSNVFNIGRAAHDKNNTKTIQYRESAMDIRKFSSFSDSAGNRLGKYFYASYTGLIL